MAKLHISTGGGMSGKSTGRDVARRIGLEVDRWPPRRSPESLLRDIVRRYDVDSVVDVGANRGDWSASIRRLGHRGPILAIEPVSSAYEHLAARASRDAQWNVLRAAMGNDRGEVTIDVAASSTLSSLLPVDYATVAEMAPEQDARITTIRRETVELQRLDDIQIPGERVLLKIDTQGYDKYVLDGANALLVRTVALQCELSLQPLYQGMTNPWRAMIDRLESIGFVLAGLFVISCDRALRLQEMDGVFVRAQEPSRALVT